MLLPLALAASVAVVAVGVPASAGAAPAPASTPAASSAATPPAVTGNRDVNAIAQAEKRAAAVSPRAGTGTRSFATAGTYEYMADTYAVGKTIGATVNTQRGVAARYPAAASSVRNLGFEIWYPAYGTPSPGDIFWGQAIPGKFPLIVFAAGFDSNPDTYQVFLHALAAQGYIVAAPYFPIEASIPGAAPASRSNAEILNQMYDMSAVITQMQAYSKQRGNFLGTAMDADKVAVIGHSDGGMTVAGMTMSTSYNDPRIDTAIVMAGAGPYGLTWNKRKVVPMMIEQATGDPYNDPDNSKWLFNHVTGSRDYLTVYGPYHIWPLIGNDPTADQVRRAVVTQLNGQLKAGSWLAFWGLVTAGNWPGVTSLKFAT
jgi:pimeloyl-ACP methyl ester carboxylesterase